MSSAIAPAAPAATVLLLRDGPSGVEAYLQQRPAGLAFAGGLWVFPGGRVDVADSSTELGRFWDGPDARSWAQTLGLDEAAARAHVAAACRELFEEAGVLLGDHACRPAALAAERNRLLAGATDLAGVLEALGARLATGQLHYWAWWITPEGEHRRYDTRFFVAALPPGSEVAAHAAEASVTEWAPAAHAAADPARTMLPPTRHELAAVARFRAVADVLDATGGRCIEPLLPTLDDSDLVLPWGERVPNLLKGRPAPQGGRS